MKFLFAAVLVMAAVCYADEEKKYVAVPYAGLPVPAAYPYALPYAAPLPYTYGYTSYRFSAPTYTVRSSHPYPAVKLDTTQEPAAYASYPYAAFPTAAGYGVLRKA
ncbi:uncharacterized protein LOC136029886 [Artemia franciscana]|uniref:Cuticle protein n=1 Tax=Artemia franciscana TaxID=6661 RepID=A0AA88HFC9_ARTSF|nr:hypothetical protein QYM36_016116 [Artemia franciscana]